MINMIITLFAIAACFYTGILYEHLTILLCGVALSILLIVSIVEVVYRLFTMKCHLDIPISMAEQNRPVDIGIRIRNAGEIVSGKVKVCLSIHNALEKKGKNTWVTISNVYRGNLRYDVPIIIEEAGNQEIELKKIRIYSFTRLVHVTKKCKDFGSVMIMPKIHSLGIRITEPVRNFMGDADVYDDIRPGHDPAELFGIRPYREKDKLQSIHWKLSAKMDDLMVKENSFPVACAVVILLDLQDTKKKKGKKDFSFDGFLELAASVSYALMDAECAHFVVWHSKSRDEIIRIRVDDEESFYLFLSLYLQDVTFISDVDLKERYREKYRNEYYLYDLLINKDLEVYKNGEFVSKVDKKRIADECEKMEILL